VKRRISFLLVLVSLSLSPRAQTKSSTVRSPEANNNNVSSSATEKVSSASEKVSTQAEARKARVAVFPALFSQHARDEFIKDLRERFSFNDVNALENPGFTGFLTDALVNTRRMDVMEREKLKEVVSERDLNAQAYNDITKIASAGQALTADYVVLPEVRSLRLIKEEAGPAYVPKKWVFNKARIALNLRVVDVKTSRIAASDISEMVITNRVTGQPSEALGAPVLDFIHDLYRQAAVREAAKVVDITYPIRLVGQNEKLWILNRGRGALQVGEEFDVFKQGERLIDPDTKESLGFVEQRVGGIRVVQVDEKTSLAEITDSSRSFERTFIAKRKVK
jgi:curli biogenesis system outer membrane secretion channel CsgG